ncbi:hypothetical protein Glove_561g6 [Diversispora epigaea]|uniref:Uncharacterized protein n=1 Tax=Diversispora epigaea TaxID=1348612 RepID=A0A397GJ61_9GLOM|nr:hypothetical protein Glove_561g6 [Diversispora epigaea]
MLEKIIKNQEKMQDDIKLVKEEVTILSYNQDCVYVICKVLSISIIAKALKISIWKKNPTISNSFLKLFDKVEEDEEDTYMTQIIKNNKIENNESFEYKFNSPERLKEASKRLAAFKKSAVPERPAVSRSNKKITEIKTSRKEKKKIKSIRKDEENDNDNKAGKGDEVYKANETYETDEGNEYHNEIITSRIEKNRTEFPIYEFSQMGCLIYAYLRHQ